MRSKICCYSSHPNSKYSPTINFLFLTFFVAIKRKLFKNLPALKVYQKKSKQINENKRLQINLIRKKIVLRNFLLCASFSPSLSQLKKKKRLYSKMYKNFWKKQQFWFVSLNLIKFSSFKSVFLPFLHSLSPYLQKRVAIFISR